MKERIIKWLYQYWPWAVLFISLLCIHLTTVSKEIGGDLGGDNAVYFLLSKAIATGQGYVDLYLPGNPPHTKFPPLFPLVLSPLHLFLNNPFPAIHVLITVINIMALIIAGYWCGQRMGSNRWGLAFASLFGLSPDFYKQSGHILAEPLYMLLCFITLYLADTHTDRPTKSARLAAIVLLALATYLTRTMGVALCLAIIWGFWKSKDSLAILSRNIPAWLLALIVFLVGAGVWHIRNELVSGVSTDYIAQFFSRDPYNLEQGSVTISDLLIRVESNVIIYLNLLLNNHLGLNRIPGLSEWMYLVLVALLGGVTLSGIVRDLARSHWVPVGFLTLSLVIVFIWPFKSFRFLVVLLPLLYFYFFKGAIGIEEGIFRTGHKNLLSASIMAIAIMVQASMLPSALADRFADGRQPNSPVFINPVGYWNSPVIDWANYDLGYRLAGPEKISSLTGLSYFLVMNRVAGEITQPDAVILSRKPMITYLYSGHKSVPPLPDPRAQMQWKNIEDKGVDYIIIGFYEPELSAMFETWPNRFQPIAEIENSRIVLLKVIKP